METLKAGYNLVERELIVSRYEDPTEVMSIIYFLRLLQSGETLPRRLKVVGLDRLLATTGDLKPIHHILYEATE